MRILEHALGTPENPPREWALTNLSLAEPSDPRRVAQRRTRIGSPIASKKGPEWSLRNDRLPANSSPLIDMSAIPDLGKQLSGFHPHVLIMNGFFRNDDNIN